jgi:phosphonoacetaldehyde hydrolase
MTTSKQRSGIRLVVADWAGTTVDHGCFAPVKPFIGTFAARGIELSAATVRGPMGMHKRDHLGALLDLPEVAALWREAQGSTATDEDVERLFTEEFMPRQMDAVPQCSEILEGLLECVAWLRDEGIKIGTTTGYFHEAAQAAYQAGRDQGYVPDANFCATDVPQARPAPWMMYRNMEALGVYPPTAVLKIGDTLPDVGEGLSAGAWTVAVTATGSEMGLSAADLAVLDATERKKREADIAAKFEAAGAHYTLPSIAQLPELIPRIDARIAQGETP